jgi:hypothetical protein
MLLTVLVNVIVDGFSWEICTKRFSQQHSEETASVEVTEVEQS